MLPAGLGRVTRHVATEFELGTDVLAAHAISTGLTVQPIARWHTGSSWGAARPRVPRRAEPPWLLAVGAFAALMPAQSSAAVRSKLHSPARARS